jgi:hypothetical protein
MVEIGDIAEEHKCAECGEYYTFQKDTHPRGGGRLVPTHRCLARSTDMFAVTERIRNLH